MKIEPIAITPAQEKAWEETRAALLWHAPAFTHILYSMLNRSGSKYVAIFTKEVPIAATDGANLILNPDTFFKYSLMERIFIVAHEVMHCILNHLVQMHRFQKSGKVTYPDGSALLYVHPLANHAMDYVINDLLIEASIEKGGLRGPKWKFNADWLHDKQIATGNDSWLDAYKKLYQKTFGGKSIGAVVKGKGFDEHLAPGTAQGRDPDTAAGNRNAAEWMTAVAAAAHAARVQGKLPAGIDRVLSEVLEPKVDWTDEIRGFFARKVGGGTWDWRKPDRRLIVRDIYSPGRSGYGAGDVVVACDTSGSIGDVQLKRFFAEMGGLLEDVRPKRLFIVWCDAEVHRVDEADDPSDLYTIRKQGAPGGGGTDFRPVFEWIRENAPEPDALVFLTDGYGTFPDAAPSYPLIWGNITPAPHTPNYPFGDVVNVPV